MQMAELNFAHNFDWNLLKTFEEIVEAGGISRAALEWDRKQPAVSLALKRLESRVGARLCERGAAGFRLTDEGRRLADVCAAMTRMVAGLPGRIDDCTAQVRGRVKVQVISNLVDPVLDEAIRTFHTKHPTVELEVDVVTWERVSRALLARDIDVGIAPAGFSHAELRYDLLFREVHRPYCGCPHPLFGRAIVAPESLAGETFILTGADEPNELTRYRLRYGLGRVVAGVSEHLEEAKRLAILGIGICFLPEGLAAPDVHAGRLWPLNRGPDAPAMDIYVITNATAPRAAAVQRFLDELRTGLPSAR